LHRGRDHQCRHVVGHWIGCVAHQQAILEPHGLGRLLEALAQPLHRCRPIVGCEAARIAMIARDAHAPILEHLHQVDLADQIGVRRARAPVVDTLGVAIPRLRTHGVGVDLQPQERTSDLQVEILAKARRAAIDQRLQPLALAGTDLAQPVVL
jgi:hypothetical protein